MIRIEDLYTDNEKYLYDDIVNMFMYDASRKEIHNRLNDYVLGYTKFKIDDYKIEEIYIESSPCLLIDIKYNRIEVFQIVLNKTQIRNDKLNDLIGDN